MTRYARKTKSISGQSSFDPRGPMPCQYSLTPGEKCALEQDSREKCRSAVPAIMIRFLDVCSNLHDALLQSLDSDFYD